MEFSDLDSLHFFMHFRERIHFLEFPKLQERKKALTQKNWKNHGFSQVKSCYISVKVTSIGIITNLKISLVKLVKTLFTSSIARPGSGIDQHGGVGVYLNSNECQCSIATSYRLSPKYVAIKVHWPQKNLSTVQGTASPSGGPFWMKHLEDTQMALHCLGGPMCENTLQILSRYHLSQSHFSEGFEIWHKLEAVPWDVWTLTKRKTERPSTHSSLPLKPAVVQPNSHSPYWFLSKTYTCPNTSHTN